MNFLRELTENDDEHQQALDQTGFRGKAGSRALFIARSTGRILFNHRGPHVQEPNEWGVWGGAMDEGENPKQAAKREAHEEAGIDVQDEDIIQLYVFHDQQSGFRYFNHLIIVQDEFTPTLDWETQGSKWVEFGDWPTPMHFGVKSLLGDQKSVQVIKQLAQKYSH